MLQKIVPKLPARNLPETTSFYVNALDFTLVASYPDYLILEKDTQEIHFFLFETLEITTNYGQVYIRTTEISKLYETLLRKSVAIHPNGKLTTKPWRQTEFSLLDPDNNLLTFGENVF